MQARKKLRFKMPTRIRGDVVRACFPYPSCGRVLPVRSNVDDLEVLGAIEVSRNSFGSVYAVAMRVLADGAYADEIELDVEEGAEDQHELSDFSGDLIRFGLWHGVDLVVTHVDGREEVVPLFNQSNGLKLDQADGWIRARSFQQTSRFGVHAFLDLYAHAEFMELGISIGNGDATASGPRGHGEFLSLELRPLNSSRYEFESIVYEDKSVDAGDGKTYLVAPREDGEPHAMPQRWERPIRLLVRAASAGDSMEPLAATSMDWTEGGYMPAGFPVAESPEQIRSAISKAAATELSALARGKNDDPNGVNPVDALWPVTGSTYGGVTGGAGIEVLPGVASVGNAHSENVALMTYARSLRSRSRNPGCMYGVNGWPILPPESGYDWEIYNRQFAWDKNKPGYHDPVGYTDAAPQDLNESTTASVRALAPWSPPDDQHLVRGFSADASLAYMTGDQLAIHYLQADAALAMAGCFHVDGVRSSKIAPEDRTPGNLGGMFGRGQAWVATLVSIASSFSDGPFRGLAKRWAEVFVDSADAAQTPIGVLGSKTFGKAFKDWPVESRWAICRAEEEIFLAHALLNLASIVDHHRRGITLEICSGIADALVVFAWVPGDAAAPDYVPSKNMAADGQVASVITPGESMPADLVAKGVPKYAYHMGAILGMVERCADISEAGDYGVDLPRFATLNHYMDWLRSKKSTADYASAAAQTLELTLWGGPGGANPGGYQHSIAYLEARIPGS